MDTSSRALCSSSITNVQLFFGNSCRTHVRSGGAAGIERVFGLVVPAGPADWELDMEMILKVALVGYVMYAVLGAPLVATQRRDQVGRRVVR